MAPEEEEDAMCCRSRAEDRRATRIPISTRPWATKSCSGRCQDVSIASSHFLGSPSEGESAFGDRSVVKSRKFLFSWSALLLLLLLYVTRDDRPACLPFSGLGGGIETLEETQQKTKSQKSCVSLLFRI